MKTINQQNLNRVQTGRKRGSVLLAVMIFSGLIFMVLGPMFAFNNHMRNVVQRRRAGDLAFYAAESGIARAVSYIQSLNQGVQNVNLRVEEADAHMPFGTAPQKITVNAGMNAGSGDDGTYFVKMYKENINDSRVIVESTGMSAAAAENLFRRITVEIQPGTFANYAFFNVCSLSTMDGIRRWIGGGENFWGPVHSNRYLFVGLNATAANPIDFYSDVTIVFNDVNYNASSIPHTHYHGLKETNADYIELPNDLSPLVTAAQNGGLYLPQDDPYYANNYDSDPLNDVATPPDVFLGEPIYNYEFSFDGDEVTITNLYTGSSFTQSINEADFNGAIVVNQGNAWVHGVVDGEVTLAALGTPSATSTPYNQASNGNIIVNGDLVYEGHPADQMYVENPDMGECNDVLGLIADRNFAIDGSVPTDAVVDAHIMVTGQATTNPDVTTWPTGSGSGSIAPAVGQDGAFFIEDGVQRDLSKIWSGYNLNDSSGADTSWGFGDLYLTGGVVHFMRGQTRNSSGGYSRIYAFDQRLFSNPPPYYPLTGDSYIALWGEQRHAGGTNYDF